jgi:PTH1 family peptidyl-tRNA hydrolase
MVPRLVIGLGNDDEKYGRTPHNVGFLCLEILAREAGGGWRDRDAVAWAQLGDIRLVKAHSFMNVCGPPLRRAADFWKVPLKDVLVVVDDFALPWGKLRLRPGGSAGGHNGLASVIEVFGTTEFPRLRVGVGPVPEGMDPADFVLRKQPEGALAELAKSAAEAVRHIADVGLETAMNRVNAPPKSL